MRADKAAVYLATLGPIGFMRPGPGTWGSIAAALLSPLFFTPLTPWIRGLILLLVVGLGIHASARAIAAFNAKDPEAVIIDEFAGQLLVFLLVRDPGASTIAAGLVLFRLFDILKPWPVGASESWFTEGVGVMADDLLAGAYALLVLHLVLTLV